MVVKVEIELTNLDAERLCQYYDTDQEHPFPLNEIIEHVIGVRVAEMLGFKGRHIEQVNEKE